MRRLLIIQLFICCTYSLIAQETPAPSAKPNPGGFYIKGGLNLANISTSDNGNVDEAKMLTSFHVGGIADIPVGDVFSIQTGLLLSGKGAKTEIYFGSTTEDNYYKIKTNPLYLEVPLNFVFKVPFATDTRLFFGAGPYLAMGIGGKTKGEQKILGIASSYEKDIAFNNDDPLTAGQEDASVNRLRRFDYGINGMAGIEAGRYMLGVNYGSGLAKISSVENNDSEKNKHRVWSISLGFLL